MNDDYDFSRITRVDALLFAPAPSGANAGMPWSLRIQVTPSAGDHLATAGRHAVAARKRPAAALPVASVNRGYL